MSVYVLCVDGNPIHSFIASDDRIAAAIARGLINKTAYGYKGDCDIILHAGLKPEDPPNIFKAVIELFSVDIDGLGCSGKVSVCQVKDSLLDAKVLDKLFFECLPYDLQFDEINRPHLVSEVEDDG